VDPPIQVAKTHRLALLGAESSGKTTLAMELTKALRDLGYNAGMVPEYLRIWCIENGRTPDFTEQEAIIEGQLALEDAAATQFAVLVCDPAAITWNGTYLSATTSYSCVILIFRGALTHYVTARSCVPTCTH
jgi:nicotinamide riboside kinase